MLGVIPARGGSKGIPRKNLVAVGGKPLIAWRIESALQADLCERLIVSTDDTEIARVARDYGAEVPFLRPARLAADDSPTIDAVLHLMTQLDRSYEAVLLMQPTSPLCTAQDLHAAAALFREQHAPAVVSVTPVKHHPLWSKTIGADGRLHAYLPDPIPHQRQGLPPVYALNGAIYLTRWTTLVEERTFTPQHTLGYIMPPQRSIDLDAPWQIDLLDCLLRRR